jgi:LETM1 and EF-hand domain-containing protein 1
MALYAPRMLPSTCVLPAQRERIERRKADRQIEHRLAHRFVFEELRNARQSLDWKKVASNSAALVAICGQVGLPTWGTSVLNRLRLKRHLNKLISDDELLSQEGTSRLSHREVVDALFERGM